MVSPNFLIVGAAKSGTTSIYQYLKQHPDVFLPATKEPCFWCYHGYDLPFEIHSHAVLDELKYQKLFAAGIDCKLRGEATAIYLHLYEQTIANLKKKIEDYRKIKIIIILRNPTDRAFSQYMMHVRDLKEDLPFERAIEHESDRINQGKNIDFWYVDRGFYAKQVKAYLESFDEVLILWYDDFQKDAKKEIDKVCNFLEISILDKIQNDEKFNTSGVPRNKQAILFIRNFIDKKNIFKSAFKAIFPPSFTKKLGIQVKQGIYKNTLHRVNMNPEIRKKLVEIYKEDVEDLETLTKRDLSAWRE